MLEISSVQRREQGNRLENVLNLYRMSTEGEVGGIVNFLDGEWIFFGTTHCGGLCTSNMYLFIV